MDIKIIDVGYCNLKIFLRYEKYSGQNQLKTKRRTNPLYQCYITTLNGIVCMLILNSLSRTQQR